MLNFIGLMFSSRYNIPLSERDYWSTDGHLRCDTFGSVMSRNLFFEIKSFPQAANNQSLNNSRMARVKPLYDLLNEKLKRLGVVHEDLLNEKLKRLGVALALMSQRFLRAIHTSASSLFAENRFAFVYKLWVLSSGTGIPYNVDIYEGKPVNATDNPLGARVVKDILKLCNKPENHRIYFENFF